jgi:hypothetical protein
LGEAVTARQGRTGPVAAKDLECGDIVHEFLSEDDDAKREYAEVRHVEPITGGPTVLVVFAGGASVVWGGNVDVRLADPDEYEQHQQRIADEQRRALLLARLEHVVDLVRRGAPLGRLTDVRFMSMRTPEAVADLAGMLGVDVEVRETPYGRIVSLEWEPEYGFEVSAYHSHSWTADEREAYEARKAAAEQADPPAAGGDSR